MASATVLIVFFRFGCDTVESSMKIVEQELNFFNCPYSSTCNSTAQAISDLLDIDSVLPPPPFLLHQQQQKRCLKGKHHQHTLLPPFFLSIDTKDTGSGDGTKRLSPCSLLILYINVNNQRQSKTVGLGGSRKWGLRWLISYHQNKDGLEGGGGGRGSNRYYWYLPSF